MMRRFTVAVLAMTALAVTGCVGPGRTSSSGGSVARADNAPVKQDPGGEQKRWDGKVRHDLDPLKKRLRNIGDDYTATWGGGVWGNSDIPGPDATWLDAVIHLDPSVAAGLKDSLGDNPERKRPVVKQGLEGEIPSGEGFTSRALDKQVNASTNPTDYVTVEAFLYPDSNILVVNYFRGA